MKATRFRSHFSGLSRQVMFWFLLISLLPLCVVSWVSHMQTRELIYESVAEHLLDVSIVETSAIKNKIEHILLDLAMESERVSNSVLLQALMKAHERSGQSAAEFVRSYPWVGIVEERASDLRIFMNAYDYYDVLLIDRSGNILLNLTDENDLGQNLFQGTMGESGFAKAARRSLESGRIVFSDLEHYAPSNGLLAGFFMAPLLDDQGEKIGLIALQLSSQQIRAIVGENIQFGDTGRRYLIGADQTLRTPGALGDDYPILKKAVKTRNVEKWVAEHITMTSAAHLSQGSLAHGEFSTDEQRHDADEEEAIIYTGPHGKSV
ncbi:MAG: cache domain-containing protein, partial [Magnetococcales bacterium]|nr:cache domain-containing protein [Magnetococcales bacterium]